MKRNLFIISALCFLFVHFAQAQSPAVWSFYHNTPRNETSFKATVPGFAVKLGALFIKEKETRRLVKRLGKVRLFVIEDRVTQSFSKRDINTFVNRLHRDGFEDFLSVKSPDSDVHFMVREKRGKVRGLVMLVKDDNDFVLMSAKCRLRTDEVLSLINDHSKEWTSKMKNKKSK
jgi:Domain of unknown function (DUF4252)